MSRPAEFNTLEIESMSAFHDEIIPYKISENKKELKEAMVEFPKYHLKIMTEDRKIYSYRLLDR
ncbi:MAG: hypothetical protein WBX29_08380 [Nitrososphaeraceae archaeon]